MKIFSYQVEYLYHIILPEKLAVSAKNCKAAKNFKPLRTKTGARSFLGWLNVFRRFVPNFSRISVPLIKKLMKGAPARFDQMTYDEIESFDTLKARLVSTRSLPYLGEQASIP